MLYGLIIIILYTQITSLINLFICMSLVEGLTLHGRASGKLEIYRLLKLLLGTWCVDGCTLDKLCNYWLMYKITSVLQVAAIIEGITFITLESNNYENLAHPTKTYLLQYNHHTLCTITTSWRPRWQYPSLTCPPSLTLIPNPLPADIFGLGQPLPSQVWSEWRGARWSEGHLRWLLST